MSKLKLTDREWDIFLLGDLFHIEIGKNIDGNKVNRESGKTAYITRKEQNNGLDGFIDHEPDFLNNNYPVLTIGNETAEPFVQRYPFFTGTKVNILKPKQEFSASVLSFIAVSLRQHKFKYSYSFTINSTRLKRQAILLPVNSDRLPDLQFMEDFMKQIEQRKISVILSYYNGLLSNNKLHRGGVKPWMLSELRWAAFAIKDICNIYSGVRLTKQNMQNGKIPFAGASDSNNGITAYIANQNASLDKNVLGVNYNGSVVESFYHPYDCLFSDDVKRLKIKSRQAGKYAYMFLKTMILKQKSKYQYGYKFNASRMAKQKILLPVDAEDQPDWQAAEYFMRKLELHKIVEYLHYLEKSDKQSLCQ